MNISFSKYQGTGNDFILIDNRSKTFDDLTRAEIAKLCDRRFGVGADGLILLNSNSNSDFEMKNYNSDGGECSMCGNGARSLVQFAHDLGLQKENYVFHAIDGFHEAGIRDGLIHLKMQDVNQVTETPVGFVLDTGSPHLVRRTSDLMTFDVVTEGRRLRNSAMFMPGGINVNFVEAYHDQIFVRTYERGVEDETLSCGTGVIASALTSFDHAPGTHSVSVQARGGSLKVHFDKIKNDQYSNIWLIGPAQKTFAGSFELKR